MEETPDYNDKNEKENEIPEIKKNEDNLPKTIEKTSQTKLWLKITAGLYCAAVIMSFVVISKIPERKNAYKTDLSKVMSLKKSAGIGIISISGAIYQTDSRNIFERGSSRISERIKKMSEKKNVKAILIDINSPGGTVSAVQDIYSAIVRAKKKTKKPFVARIGNVAASGGYYVAAACDKIVANPGSITGSIGVIFNAGNYEGLMKKIGVKSEIIKSGKFKDIGTPSRQMTKEERELLQGMIDDSYSQFIEAVSAGRNISIENLKPLADGRIYTGRQAYDVKLIDKLGDFQIAVDLAGEMGKVGKDPKIIRNVDSFDQFFSFLNVKSGVFNVKDIERIFLSGPSLEYRWEGF